MLRYTNLATFVKKPKFGETCMWLDVFHDNVKNHEHSWHIKIFTRGEWTATESLSLIEQTLFSICRKPPEGEGVAYTPLAFCTSED